MKPVPEEWDSLRLAAKASDRQKAAEKLRPAFERRLKELGYSPLAIATAVSTLTGPGTVEEALAELAENARLERIAPVPLDFEVVDGELGLPVGHSLTVTGVDREARGIRVTYRIEPPLPAPASRPPGNIPRAEARDDCGEEFGRFGQSIGLAGSTQHTFTLGSFVVPLPQPRASLLRVRMSWSTGSRSLWSGSAHEVRITL